MPIWVTSDWHAYHNKPFLYAERGFASPEEMNAAIITNHNAVVAPDDEVYFLGDGFLTCTVEEGCAFINQLNGKIHWIIGNHDTDSKLAAIAAACPNVVSIDYGARLKCGRTRFYLSHYPTLCANTNDHPVYNIHGHTHRRDAFELWHLGCYNAGMDAHSCAPVLLDDIAKNIKERKNLENGET